MNKKDLIVELSQKSGQTQSEVSKVLELFICNGCRGIGKRRKDSDLWIWKFLCQKSCSENWTKS